MTKSAQHLPNNIKIGPRIIGTSEQLINGSIFSTVKHGIGNICCFISERGLGDLVKIAGIMDKKMYL